jgi:glycerophosphoryl diester phosphodiesterase
MAAFARAVELGAQGIELDVHLSADSVPVVIHDFTVDATTDGSGAVSGMSLAELRELDAGSYFDPAFAREPIPTLDEVLESFGRRLFINVELKTTSPGDNGLERAVIALLGEHGLDRSESILLSSFNPFSLRRARKLAPHLARGLLYSPDMPLPLRRAWFASLAPHQARHPEYTMVDAPYMAWARRRGYQVNTWTVDDPAEMRRLVDLGVDGIITNVPDVLGRVLSSHT